MAEAKHAEKPAARVKMPDEAKPVVDVAADDGWEKLGPPPTKLGPAPYDGKPVWVFGANSVLSESADATWRLSRRWNNKAGQWEEYAYWAVYNGGGQPLRFVPTHWRKVAPIAAGA